MEKRRARPTSLACPFVEKIGHRSLDELRYAFPNVRVEKSEAEVLLNALFPKKFSWVPG